MKLLSWLPQNDILGHPKTRLFIGHAGLNGIFESTYHGVPMICSPFFGDQFVNAQVAKRAGFAEIVDLETTSAEDFVSLIHKVLNQIRSVLYNCISYVYPTFPRRTSSSNNLLSSVFSPNVRA